MMGFNQSDIRLAFNLWRMSVEDRYLGSVLGVCWAILNPLIMFALFTFVFGFVFKARLPGVDSTTAYSIWLICGYGPWLAITEALSAASSSVYANSSLVKNIAFKTELLPISATMLGLIPLFVSISFLLIVQLLMGDGLKWSIMWMPLVVLVQFIFLTAFGLFVAMVTTFVRDFGILLPNLLLIFLFSSPVFYPVEALPSSVQSLAIFNPIYIIASGYRAALMGVESFQLLPMIILAVISVVLLALFSSAFRRVKPHFLSVI